MSEKAVAELPSSELKKGDNVCRDFVRNVCRRGDRCKFRQAGLFSRTVGLFGIIYTRDLVIYIEGADWFESKYFCVLKVLAVQSPGWLGRGDRGGRGQAAGQDGVLPRLPGEL